MSAEATAERAAEIEWLTAEVARLRTEMESRAVVSQERLQMEGLSLARVLSMRDERDRLRAVLADTPENMAAIRAALRSMCNWGDALIEAILADQRARAGIE